MVENDKSCEQDHIETELKTAFAAVTAEQSSHDVGRSEAGLSAKSTHAHNSPTGKGQDTVCSSPGCRRSYRRRNIPSKFDLDELHSDLRSLYGSRTDLDRRCPRGPCPCGVDGEVMEVGVDDGDSQAELTEAPAQKGPFVCEVCGKVLPDRQRLKRHMNTHPGDDLVHCDICGRGFALPIHLKRHMKLHSTNRPFVCDHCGASFAEKGFLDKHMEAHQSESEKTAAKTAAAAETEQETYRCEKCNETFSKKWRLRQHKTCLLYTSPSPRD